MPRIYERLDQLGIHEILKRLEEGDSQSAIAKELGVSRQSLNDWLERKNARELAREIRAESRSRKYNTRPKCPKCGGFPNKNGHTMSGTPSWRCSNCDHQYTGRPVGHPTASTPAPNIQAQRMRDYRKRVKEKHKQAMSDK